MFLCRHRNAHPQVLDLREIQFGRYAQHHIQELGGGQGSVELSNNAHYTFIAQVLQGKIDQVEVYAFQIHAGSRSNAAALGGSITEPAHRIICRQLIELLYRLDLAYFGECFCHECT